MTDIQKMIEEESQRFNSCVSTFFNSQEAYLEGLKKGVEILQHANRWRKVSEELPEEDMYVLIGNPNASYYYVARWYSKKNRFVDTRGHSIYYSNKLEWKPIE